jgi:hypothetical protein
MLSHTTHTLPHLVGTHRRANRHFRRAHNPRRHHSILSRLSSKPTSTLSHLTPHLVQLRRTAARLFPAKNSHLLYVYSSAHAPYNVFSNETVKLAAIIQFSGFNQILSANYNMGKRSFGKRQRAREKRVMKRIGRFLKPVVKPIRRALVKKAVSEIERA